MEELKRQKVYDIKKRTYLFALDIVRFLKTMKKEYGSDVLAKQLLRAATSVGANVIEGQASSSRKDFVNFQNHALKSANETKYWLGLIRDSELASYEEANRHFVEADELSKIIAAIILSSKNKRY